MCVWRESRHVLSSLLALLALPGLVCAQSPRCADHSSSDSDSSQKTRVKIVSVEFQGDDSLTADDRAQIVDDIQRHDFWTSPDGTDDGWVSDLEEGMVRNTLQGEGYFKVVLRETRPYLVRAEPQQLSYAVVVSMNSGPRFRLKDIHLVGGTVFSPAELREQIQLSPGDVFDVSKIRQGVDALTRLYGTKGYINFTAIPETEIDDNNRFVGVTIDLDEGQKFRVRSVQILGLDDETLKLLKSVPESGQIYDSRNFKDFWEENKSLLPADAAPEDIIVHQEIGHGDNQDKPTLRTRLSRVSPEGLSVQHYDQDGWLDIVMNFQPCSDQ